MHVLCLYRPPGHEEAYVHSFETLQPKIQELVDMNGTQLLLQGGVNPELPFSYYTDLISQIRAHYSRADHPRLFTHRNSADGRRCWL
ncbi:MAG: hypothetical protein R2857_06050 [Vampirovibrionales bacterium]